MLAHRVGMQAQGFGAGARVFTRERQKQRDPREFVWTKQTDRQPVQEDRVDMITPLDRDRELCYIHIL